MTTINEGPVTKHLWHLGFTLSFDVIRLPGPIVQGDHEFVTTCKLTATPDRGDARRHFSRKGQIVGEVLSNVPLELFGREKDEGQRGLRDRYTEQCAKSIFEALREEVQTLSRPAANHAPV